MAVNPLDLQTIFAQINQIGKQQALSKEAQVLRQDQASVEIQKESEKETEDVPDTKDLQEGPGKLKDEKKDKSGSGNSRKNEENESQEKDEDEKPRGGDPDLGNNIDIFG